MQLAFDLEATARRDPPAAVPDDLSDLQVPSREREPEVVGDRPPPCRCARPLLFAAEDAPRCLRCGRSPSGGAG